VSPTDYPPTDRLLEAAIAACGSKQGNCSLEVRVSRPWRTQPETCRVNYQFSGGRRLSADVAGVRVDLNRPLKLLPAIVDKPWGREVWYTGIEARGESRVACAAGTLELHSYLSLAPEHLCAGRRLLLLKALESRPQPRLGELYFEIHRDKQEVYVVTDIHRGAYPDGVGGVRFGINQTLRNSFANDTEFRAAFTAAVGAYEAARRTADAQAQHPDDSVISDAEARARDRVLEFTELRPLRCGDVLAVPAGVPHALQHGIRVIEFQTPSYERQIIYSAQKVLTQDHWDSARAIAGMQLDAPPVAAADPSSPVIAAFEEFTVYRASLDEATDFHLPDDLPYALCAPVQGCVALVDALGELKLTAGEAAFIPRSAQAVRFTAGGPADLLIAAPGL
jgi:hypothetical protein